jgi:hypothetical protein
MSRERESDPCGQSSSACGSGNRGLSRRSFLAVGTAAATTAALSRAALAQSAHAAEIEPKFKRIPIQYIAALGDRDATSGSNAQLWGLWRQDPGPRGVRLDRYERLEAAGGVAPAQWKFDSTDWWLEEHGLIMEQPDFPVPPGQYMVTGNRAATAVLTVHAMDKNGVQRWELDHGATLYDVTHLRCRSARYTPAARDHSCSPANAQMSAFPVTPGASMPAVAGCNKQDYAVLIVIAVAQPAGAA